MNYQQAKSDLEKLGLSVYSGCRVSLFLDACEQYGLTVEELLGKFSDDDVIKAIATSLRLMGAFDHIDE